MVYRRVENAGKEEKLWLLECFPFSSPEHKVLRVSYCDLPMSVVHQQFFFKHLLLNHWANLDETWLACSLGEALQKLFKECKSIHNSGCHGNQKEKKLQNL